MDAKKTLKSLYKIYDSEDTKEIFEQNEIQANRLSAVVMLWCAVVLLVAWLLNIFGVFSIDRSRMNGLAVQGLIELAIPLTLYFVFKGRKSWLKYVMVIALMLVCTRLFSILNHNVILIMVLPVLLSSRYFYKAFTIIISALSLLSLAVGTVTTIFFGIVDLNFFPQPANGTQLVFENGIRKSLLSLGVDTADQVKRVMIHGFVPRLLEFIIIVLIAVLIAQHGHKMVVEQSLISKASAKVKSELDTAKQIQTGVVPNVFPAFPDRDEFDIYASMFPAKEVGGDFYDFFFVDENHLAMLIADVSDKGIPAALFMMAAKILLNDRTLMGGTPAEIMAFVNEQICKGNDAEMFVTVWLGILDITTGKVIATNAGHEYPAFFHNGNDFEILRDKHSFVVGGMEGVRYKDYEFTLSEGDTLYLYTDGVTEAQNDKQELFGTDRMLDALNADKGASPKELLDNVKAELDSYVNGAEQSDDITMLCLRYNGKK